MKRHLVLMAGVATLSVFVSVLAGIPEPDALLFGHVFVDRVAQQQEDGVTVTARVDLPPLGNFPGQEDVAVGRYRLGDVRAATGAISDGDSYVLHVKIESLADGSVRTPGFALVGDTLHFCVKRGSDEEACREEDSLIVQQRGFVRLHDVGLRPTFGDWNADRLVDLSDVLGFSVCMTGPQQITTPQCIGVFDAAGDRDVDLRDFWLLQQVFGAK